MSMESKMKFHSPQKHIFPNEWRSRRHQQQQQQNPAETQFWQTHSPFYWHVLEFLFQFHSILVYITPTRLHFHHSQTIITVFPSMASRCRCSSAAGSCRSRRWLSADATFCRLKAKSKQNDGLHNHAKPQPCASWVCYDSHFFWKTKGQ